MAGIIPLDESELSQLVRFTGINDAVCRLYAQRLDKLHELYVNSINHGARGSSPSPWVTQALISLENDLINTPSTRRLDHTDALYLYTGDTNRTEPPPVLVTLRSGLLRLADRSPPITKKMSLIHAIRAWVFASCDERRQGLQRQVIDHTPSSLRDACTPLINLLKREDPRVVEEILAFFDSHAWQPDDPMSRSLQRQDPLSSECLRKLETIISIL